MKLIPKDLKLAYAMGTVFYYRQENGKAIEKLGYAYTHGLEGDPLKENLALAYNNKEQEGRFVKFLMPSESSALGVSLLKLFSCPYHTKGVGLVCFVT